MNKKCQKCLQPVYGDSYFCLGHWETSKKCMIRNCIRDRDPHEVCPHHQKKYNASSLGFEKFVAKLNIN